MNKSTEGPFHSPANAALVPAAVTRVGEVFELEVICARVGNEKRTLLANPPSETNFRADDKALTLALNAVPELFPLSLAANQSEMPRRNLIVVDQRTLNSSALSTYKVKAELVSKKIEVDPVDRRPLFRQPQDVTVKLARLLQVVTRKRQMKRGEYWGMLPGFRGRRH